MRSCLPSDQHRDLACQVLNIVIMPANAVEFIDLPGIAVKATISNIVWVGGEKLSIAIFGVIFGFYEFVFHYFCDLWHLRNVVSVIFLLLFAERFCSIYYHSFFGKVQSIKTKTSTQTQQL